MAFKKNMFDAILKREGKTPNDIAQILGISPSTYYRKVNEGGEFWRSEINILIDELHIEDPKLIFFNK